METKGILIIYISTTLMPYKVLRVSSLEDSGISEMWKSMNKYLESMKVCSIIWTCIDHMIDKRIIL